MTTKTEPPCNCDICDEHRAENRSRLRRILCKLAQWLEAIAAALRNAGV